MGKYYIWVILLHVKRVLNLVKISIIYHVILNKGIKKDETICHKALKTETAY